MSAGNEEGTGKKAGFFGLVPSRRRADAPSSPAATASPTSAGHTGDVSAPGSTVPMSVAAVRQPAPVAPDSTWSVLAGLPMTSQAESLALSEADKRHAWVAHPAGAATLAGERPATVAATLRKADEMAAGLRRMSREYREHAMAARVQPRPSVTDSTPSMQVVAANAEPISAPAVHHPRTPTGGSSRARRPQTATGSASLPDATTAAAASATTTTTADPAPGRQARSAKRRRRAKSEQVQTVVDAGVVDVRSMAHSVDIQRRSGAGDAGPLDLDAMSVRQVFSRLRAADTATASGAAAVSADAVDNATGKWPAFFRKADRA